jgi:large subunit ribosomal protein L10
VALTFAQKERIVAEVAEVAQTAHSAVGAEYRGLSVEELTKLRVEARKAGVYVRVVKNTLAKRALADTDFACMDEALTVLSSLHSGSRIPGRSGGSPRASRRTTKSFKSA